MTPGVRGIQAPRTIATLGLPEKEWPGRPAIELERALPKDRDRLLAGDSPRATCACTASASGVGT